MSIQHQWIALQTILIKEVRRFLRIWPQTLLPPAITMVLYFIIFGQVIGSRIGTMGGFDYMQYVVPGLVMMSVITNSYANVASSFFGNKFQRCIEELLVSPVSNHIVLIGYVGGGVARGLLVGFVVMLLSLFFTDLQVQSIGITLLAAVLTSVLFSLGGLLNGMFANKFDDISIVPTFILTPLTYLGGVFYSIEVLPELWRSVSMANPVLYMVNAFRYGILGHSDGISILTSLGMICFFTVVLYAVAYRLLDRGFGLRH